MLFIRFIQFKNLLPLNWYKTIEKLTWVDDIGTKDEYTMWPRIDKLRELIAFYPQSQWFDNKHTKNG